MENALRWFEIYVTDMTRAKYFYERVFGFHFSKLNTRSWDIEAWGIARTSKGGSFGALTWKRDVVPSGISSVVYFASEDCEIEERLAVESGGKVHQSKYSIEQYGYMSLIQDTEGNIVGVHSRK